MASLIYNSFKKEIGDGTLDWDTNTFKIGLVDDNYTEDADHTSWTTPETDEVSGTGYTAGGATLTSTTVTADNTNDWAEYDAADVS